MTMETNTTVVSRDSYEVIAGKASVSTRTVTRVTYERKRTHRTRTFFPAAPFDAQSLAGTGALVFEGEMIGGGN